MAWDKVDSWRTGAIALDQSRVVILPEDEKVGASKLPLSEQESGVGGAHRQPPLSLPELFHGSYGRFLRLLEYSMVNSGKSTAVKHRS